MQPESVEKGPGSEVSCALFPATRDSLSLSQVQLPFSESPSREIYIHHENPTLRPIGYFYIAVKLRETINNI